MNIKFLHHDRTIGEELSKTLRDGQYNFFKIIVAYTRNSGISRIYNDLEFFKNHGGKTSIITGIDQGITSYQALMNIRVFADNNLYIHHDRNFDITFHPKLYLFGKQKIQKIIIGSSNLTSGGLFLNFEANLSLELDNSENSNSLIKDFDSYWDYLIKDINTKKADDSLLSDLLKKGSLLDEQRKREFKTIIEKTSDNTFALRKVKSIPRAKIDIIQSAPAISNRFSMTLSKFDVSSRSSDPVLLIPMKALKEFPLFWCWPNLYTNSITGIPEMYANANILIDNDYLKEQLIRLYYWKNKDEFRLKCEPIKRRGFPGDLILISKNHAKPQEFEIELIRKNTTKHKSILPLLVNKRSPQKFYSYF